ncbi:DnaA N-terminal domain-containing protein [Risungbinella massiliensis]|uniref:DnaA N-terminal domain-containing protein n=1 Tax=Risungbinella massiliensis TaxID=1329796 RepID=UPI001E42A16A|nr:DnaA N-terminal domain-containing protein [Risungbinella massiliensis]
MAYSKKTYQLLRQLEKKLDHLSKRQDELIHRLDAPSNQDVLLLTAQNNEIIEGNTLQPCEHATNIWQQALHCLMEQIPSASFDTWFSVTEAVGIQQGTLYIYTPNHFSRDWLQTQYGIQVTSILRTIEPEVASVQFLSQNLHRFSKRDEKEAANELC